MDINNFVIDRRGEKKRIRCIMIDESMITVDDKRYWLWIDYELYINKYLLMHISKDKTVLTCYYFIKKLRRLYGSKYTITYRWSLLLSSSLADDLVYNQEDRNIMERTIQYIKDRSKECFDDNFPCKDDYSKEHANKNWLSIDVVFNIKIDLSRFITKLMDSG